MIKVKVKTSKNISFYLPVPYTILKAASLILTSNKFHSQLHKWANQDLKHKTVPAELFKVVLNKQLMHEIIRDLGNYKGMVLVDAKLHDGTEVIVKL
ncbi:hypothetical protein M3204_20115 [Mesobacillus subterraneus]|uniref:hypothetical protein n=1 Tax=Mesobacillus subterraneus TaxID=285983 RepID=UPI0020400032|nr:hypothetical protein [Mesobacillus subterraneus]MCM3666733.1 hypothetical protein [Mesobacillus subterraneus]MCM3685630.1 hypothetical protein [Mesobacillus subterraneus]